MQMAWWNVPPALDGLPQSYQEIICANLFEQVTAGLAASCCLQQQRECLQFISAQGGRPFAEELP